MQNSGAADVGEAAGSRPDKLAQSPLEDPTPAVFPSGLLLLV
jgi:hypothetical protein